MCSQDSVICSQALTIYQLSLEDLLESGSVWTPPPLSFQFFLAVMRQATIDTIVREDSKPRFKTGM